MKRMTFMIYLASAMMTLSACKVQPAGSETGDDQKVELWAGDATPPLATDLMIRSDSKALNFRWQASPQVALEPLLLADLRLEAENMRTAADREASDDMNRADEGVVPFRQHELRLDWAAEAETDRLLVLSGTIYQYTGGAHGMTGFTSAFFDRTSRKRINFNDLFNDAPATLKVLEKDWCTGLQQERDDRRRGLEVSDLFQDCPTLSEQVIVPQGEGKITNLMVLVEPYVAGPYSEGTYKVYLPLPDVQKHVKSKYQSAFEAN